MRWHRLYSPQVVVVGHPTLREQEVNEVGGVHTRVGVGIGDEGGDKGHNEDLQPGVLAHEGCLTETAPLDVELDEQHANYSLSVKNNYNEDWFHKARVYKQLPINTLLLYCICFEIITG